jgi:hypothetical protein
MTALNIRISKELASGKKPYGEIIKLKPKRRSSDKAVAPKRSQLQGPKKADLKSSSLTISVIIFFDNSYKNYGRHPCGVWYRKLYLKKPIPITLGNQALRPENAYRIWTFGHKQRLPT